MRNTKTKPARPTDTLPLTYVTLWVRRAPLSEGLLTQTYMESKIVISQTSKIIRKNDHKILKPRIDRARKRNKQFPFLACGGENKLSGTNLNNQDCAHRAVHLSRATARARGCCQESICPFYKELWRPHLREGICSLLWREGK